MQQVPRVPSKRQTAETGRIYYTEFGFRILVHFQRIPENPLPQQDDQDQCQWCKIPVLKTASLFSCLTSLRLSDVLSLCWEEIVDFAAGGKCVHTITQKTKTEDIIPISDEALELIGYSPEKTGLVFKGLKRSWTQQPMKEWIRSAGITKNITFHSYRRTYATLQAAAGTDIRTIQSNMAHKSITTTQRYMKVVDSNKRKATTRITLTRKGGLYLTGQEKIKSLFSLL